jgi:hypothetical protein
MSGPLVRYELCDRLGRVVVSTPTFGLAVDVAKAIANKDGQAVTIRAARPVAVIVPDSLPYGPARRAVTI